MCTASPSPSSVGDDYSQRDQYDDLGVCGPPTGMPDTGLSFNMAGPSTGGLYFMFKDTPSMVNHGTRRPKN